MMRRHLATVLIAGALAWLACHNDRRANPKVAAEVDSAREAKRIDLTQLDFDTSPPVIREESVRRYQVAKVAKSGAGKSQPVDLRRLGVGAPVRLELFPELTVKATIRYEEPGMDGRVRFVATRDDKPGHVFLTGGDGQLAALIELPEEGDVQVQRYQEGLLLVSQFDRETPMLCSTTSGPINRLNPAARPVDRGRVAPRPRQADDQPSQIDVGILYTPEAGCNGKPASDCPSELKKLGEAVDKWITQANTALSCSNVNARVEVKMLGPFPYTESGTLTQDLCVLSHTAEGSGAALKRIREENALDVILLLVSKGGAAEEGRANVFPADGTAETFGDYAIGVVVRGVAISRSVLLHELGHVMGGGHELDMGNGRFDYSHGKILPTRDGTAVTLMATIGKYRQKVFSGIGVYLPESRIETGTDTENNVKTFNEGRAEIEQFQGGVPRSRLPPVPCFSGYYLSRARVLR